MLMPVLSQSLLTLVGRHLVTLPFLTAWHIKVFLKLDNQLFLNILAVLHLAHENFCGLEGRNRVLGDGNGNALGDVACSLLRASARNKAAEATEEDGFTVHKGCFYNIHESLNGFLDSDLLDPGAFSNLVDDVCFCHLNKIILKV